MWSETQEYPIPKQVEVSQLPIQPLVDLVAEPSQPFVHPTLILESDPYVIEPISSFINPTLPSESDFHEAVESISISINTTLPLESEVSASHIFFVSSELTEQGGTELASDQPTPRSWIDSFD